MSGSSAALCYKCRREPGNEAIESLYIIHIVDVAVHCILTLSVRTHFVNTIDSQITAVIENNTAYAFEVKDPALMHIQNYIQFSYLSCLPNVYSMYVDLTHQLYHYL